MKIPFVDLTKEADYCFDELIEDCKSVISSGMYINGPNVKSLESSLEEFLDVKNIVTVGNGSDAITIILRALNIGRDDEVIVPTNSFIATAWAVAAVGAKPVFCDVNDDLLIDYNCAAKLVNKKTKAIILVHLTGRVVDINKFETLASQNNLYLLEDAAQSFGAKYNNSEFTGSLGIAGAFSLHPLKNLGIYGDGGFISTNNDMVACNCRKLRNHGLINRDESDIWGFNSRLDELQAAFALTKMKYIEKWTHRYIEIATTYDKLITSSVIKPIIRENHTDVYHNYVIRVQEDMRNLFIERMAKEGVETKVHYPIPIHLQACTSYLKYTTGDIPNAEILAKQMISLPIYPSLSEPELVYISEAVNSAYSYITN